MSLSSDSSQSANESGPLGSLLFNQLSGDLALAATNAGEAARAGEQSVMTLKIVVSLKCTATQSDRQGPGAPQRSYGAQCHGAVVAEHVH